MKNEAAQSFYTPLPDIVQQLRKLFDNQKTYND